MLMRKLYGFAKAEDDDCIRMLRAALKLMLRRFGLRAIKVEAASTDTAPTRKEMAH